MWKIFGFLILVGIVIFGLISIGAIGYIPDIEELENPIDKYASQVVSADGQLLFTFSQNKENRIFVKYSDLSPHLIDALIATEDIRFYKHSGIDVIGFGTRHRKNPPPTRRQRGRKHHYTTIG